MHVAMEEVDRAGQIKMARGPGGQLLSSLSHPHGEEAEKRLLQKGKYSNGEGKGRV